MRQTVPENHRCSLQGRELFFDFFAQTKKETSTVTCPSTYLAYKDDLRTRRMQSDCCRFDVYVSGPILKRPPMPRSACKGNSDIVLKLNEHIIKHFSRG